MKITKLKYWLLVGLKIGTILPLFYSCNRDFERLIPDFDYQDTVSIRYGSPKVLYIIVDGARGESVKNGNNQNINSLLAHSIYSWNSISQEGNIGDAANWADMLTGVTREKHGINNDDFQYNNLDRFPTIFQRVKEEYPNMHIQGYSSSQLLNEKLSLGIDLNKKLNTDEEVKASLINGLETESVDLLFGQFSDVDRAGKLHGYDLSKEGYRSAISDFDKSLGEILFALRERENYKKEQWLIVVASNRGGAFELADNDNTIFSDTKINTFILFHAENYKARFLGKPYLGNKFQGEFARFSGERKARLINGDNSVYNLGSEEEFTLELKIKKKIAISGIWPSIISKRADWGWGTKSLGWNIFLEENYWVFNAQGDKGGGQALSRPLGNSTWNSLAVVAVKRSGRRYVRLFTNGDFNSEIDITNYGSLNSSAPFTIGNLAGKGAADLFISDVRIWKTSMPDSTIKRFSCDTYIDPGHPYYDFLAGYWPMNGKTEQKIVDVGPLLNHLEIENNSLPWETLNEYICAPSAQDLGSLVPRNIDIPTQLLTWFKIPRQEKWQLDGRVWLAQ